ncbi:phospholipase C, phosphocholine-specific [Chitinophaga oryzae]|uniref:phospholipase C n=1 Tax=Chitinophaga oryzae TaxID=2725414 RepID=A0ABX6LB76_9BACT|nr:phospholipase C, phosphocholine-specific [Chitinophaga oryzae]QJB37368.1 phospholipase C, phosphocholine-specific [Chitinophaga oryzae]
MESRRDFIKKLTALSGSMALGSLPGAVQRAFAINPDPGTTFMDAEHIVFLMQENRSFDHLLGTLRGVRGFNDPRFLRQKNCNPVWLQSDSQGNTYAPVRCDIKNTNVTWSGGCPHEVENQIGARNAGFMDKWIDQKTPKTMQYFTREDHPFYHALADAFTVCDHYFCSSLTGTSSNRSMFWTGKLRGLNICDLQLCRTKEHMDNTLFSLPGTCTWETFPEVLQANEVSWKVYQNQTFVNYLRRDDIEKALPGILKQFESQPAPAFHASSDPFEAILQIPEMIAAALKPLFEIAAKTYLNTDDLKIKWLSNFSDNVLESFLNYYPLLTEENRKVFKEAQSLWESLAPKTRDLHSRAFTTNIKDPLYNCLKEITLDDGTTMSVPAGDILYQFRQDVRNGELPTVSWLVAPEVFSDHPVSPQYGPWYVSEVLDILTSKPEVWKKTIFIINFDENDGFFDHMPPYVPSVQGAGKCSPGIDTDEELAKDFNSPIGLGYRVPMLVVSPWSRGGWVNSQVLDHTSTLMFLEKFLNAKKGNNNIQCSNISQFRRTVCGDITSAFRPYNGEKIVFPKPVDKEKFFAQVRRAKTNAQPGTNLLNPDDIEGIRSDVLNSTLLPKQEEGIRPANGLLYQLYAEACADKSKNQVTIALGAGNEIYGQTCWGAAFHVYWGFDDKKPRSYVAKAGAGMLTDSFNLSDFDDNAYHIVVHGPNGFSREFSGTVQDPGIGIACTYEFALQDARTLTGNVEIVVKIQDKSISCTHLVITDNAYGQPDIMVPLRISRYDDTITQVINLEHSLNWYDFTVSIPGNKKYYRRYTGHVETGLPGYTDPYMGRWDGATKPPLT